MDLPSTLGARRLCYMAGRPFWVRPCPLEGWAEIAAWLDDMLPGRADRELPPRFGDDASQELLRSDAGLALLAWIALRDSGVDYEGALKLWARADEPERSRLISVLFARRRSLQPSSDGQDIGETWCGEGIAELATTLGMDGLRGLSLDQVEFLLSGGKVDRHADPDTKAVMEVQRMWESQQAAKRAEAGEQPPAPAPDPAMADVHRAWLEAVEAADGKAEGDS